MLLTLECNWWEFRVGKGLVERLMDHDICMIYV